MDKDGKTIGLLRRLRPMEVITPEAEQAAQDEFTARRLAARSEPPPVTEADADAAFAAEVDGQIAGILAGVE